MNCRDRVVAAVHLEEPDVVPIFAEMTSYMMEEILGKKLGGFSVFCAKPEHFQLFRDRTSVKQTSKEKVSAKDIRLGLSDFLEVCKKIGTDLVVAGPSWAPGRYFAEGDVTWLDEKTFEQGGLIWRHTPEHNTMFYLRGALGPIFKDPERFKEWSASELAQIEDPKSWENFDINLDTSMKLYRENNLGVMGATDGCVMSTYLTWNFESFFKSLYQNPSLVQSIMEVHLKRGIAIAERMVEQDIDAMWVGDDIAYKNGPMMPPSLFKKMILPLYKRLFDVIKREGIQIIFHSDGNTWLILDDLISIGLNGLQAIEGQAGMDIGKLKNKYGDRLCFIGNVDCGRSLLHGSPVEVAMETRDVIRKAGNGGGLIMASSNSLLAETPTKNYLAMINTTKKYGRYLP